MTYVVIYLYTDTEGNDLLDSAGNPFAAGWYRFNWPKFNDYDGPFQTESEAASFD